MRKANNGTRGGDHTPAPGWTADQVLLMVANPLYAGIGRFPPIVEDALWLDAFVRLVRDLGADRACGAVRMALAETFSPLPHAVAGWPAHGVSELAGAPARAVGERLLADLRDPR
jgi:hypothetical protein